MDSNEDKEALQEVVSDYFSLPNHSDAMDSDTEEMMDQTGNMKNTIGINNKNKVELLTAFRITQNKNKNYSPDLDFSWGVAAVNLCGEILVSTHPVSLQSRK